MKKLFRSILLKIFPELKRLQLFLADMENIQSINKNNEINDLAKLDAPYRIYDSSISAYSYVSVNSRISLTTIGKFCSIGPNFLCGWGIHPVNGLSTSPSFYSSQSYNGLSLATENKIEERLPINIGNDVFIGANVVILDGISIGSGVIIAAGAVVTKNIPDYAIVAGVPATIVKYRFEAETISKLLSIAWWNWNKDQLKEVEKNFFMVEDFIGKFYKKN